jgi:ATP-dependent RNA helicase DDX54/DBP10
LNSYSLTDGVASSFTSQAAAASFSLAADDDGNDLRPQRASSIRWDRKQKKFVKGNGVGADNKKLIKTESGNRLPISFKSGIFEEWKDKKKMRIPKIGDAEVEGGKKMIGQGGRKWRHDGMRLKKEDIKKEKERGKVFSKKGGVKNVEEIRKERRLKAARKHRSTRPSKKRK